jgi:hypothetical protein
MPIIIAICGLAIVFSYELRHRIIAERLTNLESETHKLSEEVKRLDEELKKKQDTETKKGFKLPFMP